MILNDFLPDVSAPANLKVSNGMNSEGEFRMVTEEDIKGLVRPRAPFTHKGTYGHALLIAGAERTMGAALLSAMGCLHSGAGLTTAAIPQSGLCALNTQLPEVMYVEKAELLKDRSDLTKYSAIGIGPGLSTGMGHSTENIQLLDLLLRHKRKFVADADALPLLKPQLRLIPKGCVLTPHVKEFDALFGKHETWWNRLETGRDKARKKGIVIVLKNQFTFIIDEGGTIYVNPTGNPAMAQGGMGDVLTGIITAYLAQQYTPAHAAIIGCYIHGRAGDELAATHFSIPASKLAAQLPLTIKKLLD